MIPPCMHCQRPIEDHTAMPSGRDSQCPDGSGRVFDVMFTINPAAAEFVKENLDKSPEELTQMWIDKVCNQKKAST